MSEKEKMQPPMMPPGVPGMLEQISDALRRVMYDLRNDKMGVAEANSITAKAARDLRTVNRQLARHTEVLADAYRLHQARELLRSVGYVEQPDGNWTKPAEA